MPSIPSSYLVHIWYGMAGLQSGNGCTMTDSVVWVQYINMTDAQLCLHSKCCANVLTLGSKNHLSAVNVVFSQLYEFLFGFWGPTSSLVTICMIYSCRYILSCVMALFAYCVLWLRVQLGMYRCAQLLERAVGNGYLPRSFQWLQRWSSRAADLTTCMYQSVCHRHTCFV